MTRTSLRPGTLVYLPDAAPSRVHPLDLPSACDCLRHVLEITAPPFPDITAASGHSQPARCLVCGRTVLADAEAWQPSPPLPVIRAALAALEQRRLRLVLLLERIEERCREPQDPATQNE